MRRPGTGLARRGGYRGIGASSGPEHLLSYADATFTRASEASAVDPRASWAWYDTATPWPGVDAARILPDGAILLEDARTNSLHASENLAYIQWIKQLNLTGGTDAAPDGGADAHRLNPDEAAPDRAYANAVGAAATACVMSLYAKAAGGTKLQIRDWSYPNRTDLGPLTSSWVRKVDSQSGASSTPLLALIPHDGDEVSGAGVAGEDVRVWGMQRELGATWPTSPIRCVDAAATRAAEACAFAAAPTWMLSRRFRLEVWPLFDSSEIPTTAAILGFGIAGSRLEMTSAGAITADVGGVTKVTKTAITFSRYQQLTITVDPGAGSIGVAGATTGDGTTTDTAWTWAAGSLQVGDRVGGSSPWWGLVGRPRKA